MSGEFLSLRIDCDLQPDPLPAPVTVRSPCTHQQQTARWSAVQITIPGRNKVLVCVCFRTDNKDKFSLHFSKKENLLNMRCRDFRRSGVLYKTHIQRSRHGYLVVMVIVLSTIILPFHCITVRVLGNRCQSAIVSHLL